MVGITINGEKNPWKASGTVLLLRLAYAMLSGSMLADIPPGYPDTAVRLYSCGTSLPNELIQTGADICVCRLLLLPTKYK